jgi:phospholipid/cholesterol/gamma-HCH transport system substrate-binding protein
VARNVAKVSESVANVFGGPEGEGSLRNILKDVESSMGSIDQASRLLANTLDRNDERVDDIIANIQTISDEIAKTVGAGGDIKQSAENIASLTSKLDSIASSLNDMMESTNAGDSSVRSTVEELNKTMKHLSEIARKIDEGEGTVGRLINDDELVHTVETAAEDIGELLGGLSRLQTEIEWRAQYEVPFSGETRELEAAVKNILRLRLKPKPDKYYLIEVVSDPRGKSTRIIETETVSSCPVGTDQGCTEVSRQKTETTTIAFDDLKFSFQFAKRFYFLTLRFGILENTGGVGFDLNFFDDDLELRFDAFDFTRRDPDQQVKIFPRFRFAASYEFFDHVGIQAGIDDPFNDRLRTWFVGGLLRFTDEDLKMLLAVAPTP